MTKLNNSFNFTRELNEQVTIFYWHKLPQIQFSGTQTTTKPLVERFKQTRRLNKRLYSSTVCFVKMTSERGK